MPGFPEFEDHGAEGTWRSDQPREEHVSGLLGVSHVFRVTSEDAFFAATGITDGELLAGVRYRAGGATTHSLVMRARSGTIRTIQSEHKLWKLRAYSAVNFDGTSPVA